MHKKHILVTTSGLTLIIALFLSSLQIYPTTANNIVAMAQKSDLVYSLFLPLIQNGTAASPATPTPQATATITPTPKATATSTPTPTNTPPEGVCLTAEENELAQLINQYRAQNGLQPIPVTESLTNVAQLHVKDLHNHNPDSGTDPITNGECNMHSWSANGNWTPVCYISDHTYATGMWNKPREITNNIYTGNGYEIAYGTSGQATAAGSLSGWQNSSSHNDVILNSNGWGSFNPWPGMGIGIYEHHAVVWFGDKTDPQGTVSLCQN